MHTKKKKKLRHTQTQGHNLVHTYPQSTSSVCPWVSVSFVWPPSVTLSLFLPHVIFLSLWHTSGCQTEQTDWLRVPMCMCVCVPERRCDYSLCYVSCCGPILPLSLPPSPAFIFSVCLSMCLRHSSSGTLRAQRSGWSTWWSLWLVVWRGLTWHGGSRGRGGQPVSCHHRNTAEQTGTPTLTVCPSVQF